MIDRRIKQSILRAGDAFTAGGSGRKGLFRVLSPSRAAAYVTDSVIGPSDRPMLLLLAPYDDSTAEDDVVVYQGKSYDVKRVWTRRYRDAVVARLLVLIPA
ncbi:MAG: hypothetical protein HONBIEJF_02098 [Fimbriimonadaceae bacterium]|nr:hypothetical protein [Fimbriimonadaceae bacterium]